VVETSLAPGKKNAQRRCAWLIFEDESSFSQRPPIRSTWAPKGKTPVIVEPFRWATLGALAALRTDAQGHKPRWFLRLKKGAFRSHHFLAFLRSLKRHCRRPVLLVWDRLPAHRSGSVQAFLKQERSWLQVEWFPPYSPQLNPVELLWANLDATALANTPFNDIPALARRARKGVSKIQQRSTLGHSFLKHTGLF
jgi:transposase